MQGTGCGPSSKSLKESWGGQAVCGRVSESPYRQLLTGPCVHLREAKVARKTPRSLKCQEHGRPVGEAAGSTSKATGVGLSKLFGAHTVAPSTSGAKHEAVAFSVYTAGLWSSFDLMLPFCVHYSFGMGMFTVSHHLLEVCNLFILFV
jgi:hypothetical protein